MAETASYPTAEALLKEARAATGLDDFGDDFFRTGLTHLLDSLNRDACLSDQGMQKALTVIRRRLSNRLRIENWYRAHPETERQQNVDGPVAVTGLPRTGSTALGNMLSLDPRFRNLRGWEQEEPVPPPVLGEEEQDDRRRRASAEIERLYREDDALVSRHIHEVDASMEDTEVLGLQFAAQQMTLPVWSYFDWWRDADMQPAFAYHRRVVQLLQSRRPPHFWLFKAPHHSFHLDAMVLAYPGAKFVMTHRDPARVVPSYASLVSAIWPDGAGHDPHQVGRYISRHLRIGMERALTARDRIGEDRFIDVHHHDLNHDPLGTLQRIYDFLGFDLGPSMRDDVTRWLGTYRSGAHGEHRYTPEQFGLTAADIRDEYDFYIRRFGVRTGD